MSSIYLQHNEFTFDFDNKTYIVAKTNHLEIPKEINKHNALPRYAYFNANNLTDILIVAMQNNYTSFRDKGKIVIQFKDNNNVFYSILSKLSIDNKITIITIYKDKFNQNYDSFRQEKNRINLHQVFNFDTINYRQENLDKFMETHCGVSTGIKAIKHTKVAPGLKIINKNKANKKPQTLEDFQLSEEEKKYFLKTQNKNLIQKRS